MSFETTAFLMCILCLGMVSIAFVIAAASLRANN